MSSGNLDRNKLTELLGAELQAMIRDWLPEMVGNLPDELLDTAAPDDLLLQAKALMLMQRGELDQELVLSNSHGNRITVISSENRPGTLSRLLRGLPADKPLIRARIFSSIDRRFIIDLFDFADEHTRASTEPLSVESIQRYVQRVVQLTGAASEDVLCFLNAIGSQNRQYSDEVLAQQYQQFHAVVGQDCGSGAWVAAERHLVVAMGNTPTRQLLERAAQFLGRAGVGIQSATCDDVTLQDGEAAVVTLQTEQALSAADIQELKHFLYLDDEVLKRCSSGDPSVEPLVNVELRFAVARLIRSRLNVSSRFRLSLEEVLRVLERYDSVTSDCLRRILFRFRLQSDNPEINFLPQRDTSELTDRNVMQALLDLPECLQKSNLPQVDRQCLAFRLNPTYFNAEEHPSLPFGIFYVYGKGFDGFHVRFRDIARGGMRLVRTRNREHYLFESQRIFNEVFDLAWAQNLKNKDIPEGGAKAVVMLKPAVDPSFAGRRFVDGLLDLILPGLPVGDYYQDPEYLYLGPDENVAPELIDWIVANAEKRGYDFFNTFISSKPRLGINHKQYGVTSEGVVVFLTQCLLEQGKDPSKDCFSVKLTGGPDGDVGGNAIRFLLRDFGQRVRVVGIADGSGCATDPAGLDHRELMRLVEQNLPIDQFQPTCLSGEGRLTGVATFQEQGIRNNMHFRVSSDVFLPCGGRPGSINQFNMDLFFGSDGQPASAIIVEGANLFITPVAREYLSKRGVWIVKDSSANKCGVICSSLEILAGMLLDDQQFLEIKERYVSQVIDRLRALAQAEAISLFQEKRRQPMVPLPDLSVEVSRMILKLSEVIERWMDCWDQGQWENALAVLRQTLPTSLLETAGDDALRRLPAAYRVQCVSAMLASELVYREGCRNLELMEDSTLIQLAQRPLVPGSAGLTASR